MKNRKGFTLIELLAVILILGIIALIAIPTVNGIIEQARKGATEASGNEIIKGAELYYNTCDIDSENKDLYGHACIENLVEKDGADYKIAKIPTVTDASNVEVATKTLKNKINVKGDFPDIDKITVFERDSDGDVKLQYEQGTFTCTNIDKPNKAVVCDKKAS